jgi:hypothetical protein
MGRWRCFRGHRKRRKILRASWSVTESNAYAYGNDDCYTNIDSYVIAHADIYAQCNTNWDSYWNTHSNINPE